MANMDAVPVSALPTKMPALYEGRISRTAFEAVVGIFYGLAIVVATIRFILQMKFYRRLCLDDYFLIFACVTLTAGTILGYANVGNLYWSEDVNYNPTYIHYLFAEHFDVAAHINIYERLYYSYPALLWTSIFVVKFAYLAFFRRLINRIPPLIKYWRIVIGITIVSFPICIVSIYIACVKWGLEAAVCLQPPYFHRALGLAIFDIILDIGTDLLIMAIPLRLLWSVKIEPRHKFILGIFLSLNLFMAVTASIRVSGLKFRGTFDEVWLYLWQQIEACIAVAMISLTAFRSAFVASESSRARRGEAKKSWLSSVISAVKRSKARRRSDEEASQELPSIPSGTLTGMRTFINGGRRVQTSQQTTGSKSTLDLEPDEWALHNGRQNSEGDTR